MARVTRMVLDLTLKVTKPLKPAVGVAWQYAKVEMAPPMTSQMLHGPKGKQFENWVSKQADSFINKIESQIKEIDAEALREIKRKEEEMLRERERVKAAEAKKLEEARIAEENKMKKEQAQKKAKAQAAEAKSKAEESKKQSKDVKSKSSKKSKPAKKPPPKPSPPKAKK